MEEARACLFAPKFAQSQGVQSLKMEDDCLKIFIKKLRKGEVLNNFLGSGW